MEEASRILDWRGQCGSWASRALIGIAVVAAGCSSNGTTTSTGTGGAGGSGATTTSTNATTSSVTTAASTSASTGVGCVGASAMVCGNACVDTSNDPANCGGCGMPCPTGEVCSQGKCGLSCLGGSKL